MNCLPIHWLVWSRISHWTYICTCLILFFMVSGIGPITSLLVDHFGRSVTPLNTPWRLWIFKKFKTLKLNCITELKTVLWTINVKSVKVVPVSKINVWKNQHVVILLANELSLPNYWVPQKLPQIYTVIACICIGKVAWFAV